VERKWTQASGSVMARRGAQSRTLKTQISFELTWGAHAAPPPPPTLNPRTGRCLLEDKLRPSLNASKGLHNYDTRRAYRCIHVHMVYISRHDYLVRFSIVRIARLIIDWSYSVSSRWPLSPIIDAWHHLHVAQIG